MKMNRRNFLIGSISVLTAATVVKENIGNSQSVIIENAEAKQLPKHNNKIKIHYHKPVKINMSKYDKAVLIETIWGEARGESDIGKIAVVHVILNRHLTEDNMFKKYKTISQLCLKKYQFSCWLDKHKMRHIKRDETFDTVKESVEKAIHLYSNGIDYSNNALYYYSTDIKKPKWAKTMKLVNFISKHKFYC